jgi:hypothetical protein
MGKKYENVVLYSCRGDMEVLACAHRGGRFQIEEI